jgi:hypothetical protein
VRRFLRENVKDWRFVAALAALAGAIALIILTVILFSNSYKADQRDAKAEEAVDIAKDVKAIAEDLKVQGDDVQVLVDYVEDLKANDDGRSSATLFIDLLCASEDPVRLAACAEVRKTLQPEE